MAQNDEDLLHKCVFSNDIKSLKESVKSFAVEKKDKHGNTALHLAAMLGHSDCIDILLANNAQVKVKNLQGWTPLAEAFYRLDTTLVDFNDMKWERGDISFVFNGNIKGSKNFTILDNKLKVYQKFKHEETEDETQDDIDILMSSDIISAQIPTKNITFSRLQSGWFVKQGRTQLVGQFPADFYSVQGLTLEQKKRREHLSPEDLQKNKAILESLSKGNVIENHEIQRRPSLPTPKKANISWEDYIRDGNPPCLGRPIICKDTKKTFKATLAMSEEFPMTVEQVLDVLEIVAPLKQYKKLREFMDTKLPPGFPVKIEIPVFPTVTAKVTFQQFKWDDSLAEDLFIIPNEYREDPNRFPEL
ncbi:DgyrCDS1117 [Dimorphilus gyrociliatus]|uniref:DgyrCDS1117 n=1 Tax=Dimorphilus gyrociliatus TaxID=2664684 RepID=A0A7I8V6C0_9ANNE|nr:DgyrCDS1117 [Dimorphilus gyrociliatus]